MTLEDKFLPYCDHEYGNREDNAANCADVANEHAVSFAAWIINNPDVLTCKNSLPELLQYFNENYNQ